jgi:ketosteroid isomerase-like protein
MRHLGGDWRADAQQILDALQEKVAARDLPALSEFFEDPAVLIATASDGRTPAARAAYLEAVVTQPAAVRWDWRETTLFFESADALGFAAFGDVVLVDGAEEARAPIRATFFAVRSAGGWRLREFHGSIAQSPS